MVQATTPTFIMTLPDTVDLLQANHVVWTLEQGKVKISKSDEDLTFDSHTVTVSLSQEETLILTRGNAQIQLNWTYADGSRACSNIENVPVDPNLYKAVI